MMTAHASRATVEHQRRRAVRAQSPPGRDEPDRHARETPASEAEARKARSIARIEADGVPVLPTLPMVDTVAEAKIRTRDEVVGRLISLSLVALEGELWALGFDEELPKPDRIVDASRIVRLVLDKGPTKLRDKARLRSPSELLDAADLIDRYSCACVNARFPGKPAPPVECDDHALHWLIGYEAQPGTM